MIREQGGNELKIDVYLKNGEVFLAKDITTTPFGEHEKVVCFWHEDKVRVYSWRAVAYVDLYGGNKRINYKRKIREGLSEMF